MSGKIEEIELLERFATKLIHQGKRKAELYDGVKAANRLDSDIDFYLRCVIEELGEVASAITRDRFLLAMDECIDVAHTAFLIWLALQNKDI